MMEMKISAVIGVVGSTIGLMLQAAQGNTSTSGVLTAIGFGGFAGFATAFMIIGSYKTRVDRHEKVLEELHRDKVSTKELGALSDRIDEMHDTLQTIIKPIIEGHFKGGPQ